MPGNIIQATPTDVLPAHLSRAFHEELHLEADLNAYPDGSSDRNPLVINNRHYFTMQQSLMPSEWQALRTFYFAHLGRPFYFYNPRETVPPFSFDPTGQNTVGRYTVAFDGNWNETYGADRNLFTLGYAPTGWAQGATVSLGLREVL